MPPTDGEKLTSVTDGGGVRAALATQRVEDSSESREEEQAVSRAAGEAARAGCAEPGGSLHGTQARVWVRTAAAAVR